MEIGKEFVIGGKRQKIVRVQNRLYLVQWETVRFGDRFYIEGSKEDFVCESICLIDLQSYSGAEITEQWKVIKEEGDPYFDMIGAYRKDKQKQIIENMWADLFKLDKNELMHLFITYYEKVHKQAEIQMKDQANERRQEWGRVRMTDLNFLRNLLHYKAEGGALFVAEIEELRPSDNV